MAFSHAHNLRKHSLLRFIGWFATNTYETKVQAIHRPFHSFVDFCRKPMHHWVLFYKTDIRGSFFFSSIPRCSLWLKYGFLANENLLIFVNSIGATLFMCYVIVFWRFTINKRSTCRQLFSVLLVLSITITYTEWYEVNRTEAIEVIGETNPRCASCNN